MAPFILFILAFVPMLLEARLSRANDRRLRAAGAVEPRRDVYAVMQVAYPACFAAMILESFRQPPPLGPAFLAGAGVFVLAKMLKYWAIATLGTRWTFRVLVPPRSERIVAGPYRVMRHPNYVAVAGELVGMALMAATPVIGLVCVAGFGALMLMRVRVEEAALHGIAARHR
jgi:methyltransferase